MSDSPDEPKTDMAALFDQVLKHVEAPKVGAGGFRMLGTLLESNPYLGRIVTGRVFSGSIRTNTPVKVLDREGDLVEAGRVSKILAFRARAGVSSSACRVRRGCTARTNPARSWSRSRKLLSTSTKSIPASSCRR